MEPYRMRSVRGPLKMHHAIDACVGCAATLVAVGIKLLLGKDVAARLGEEEFSQLVFNMIGKRQSQQVQLTSHENDTILTPLYKEPTYDAVG